MARLNRILPVRQLNTIIYMAQTIIAILIVAAAAGFAVRRLFRTLKGKGGCPGGCSNCPARGGECHCNDSQPFPDIHLD